MPVSANCPEKGKMTPILMVPCAPAAAGSKVVASRQAPANSNRFIGILPFGIFLSVRMPEVAGKEKRRKP